LHATSDASMRRALFCGEHRLAEAAAAVRDGRFQRRSG